MSAPKVCGKCGKPMGARCPTCSECGVCGKRLDAHSGDVCPYCGGAIEHCSPERQAIEREGRRRMAAARAAAGAPLDAVDRAVLADRAAA